MQKRGPRIFLTGTGGQGTLTSTRLLGQAALDCGIAVTAGEVHGMAQRGGVVESTLLLGGWQSPRLDFGEADILLGFEALETLRAIPYLAENGAIFSSDEILPPLSVCLGQETCPALEDIQAEAKSFSSRCFFLDCRSIGEEAGNIRAGNSALLGAACASGLLPFGLEALESAMSQILPQKIQGANLAAARMGALAWERQKEEIVNA